MRPARLVPIAAALLLSAATALASTDRTTLIPRISMFGPAGWDDSVVPRLTTGAAPESTLHVPAFMTREQAVYFNYGESHNAAAEGYWTDQLTLDGVPVQTVMRYNGAWASGQFYSLDIGPFYLMGGRHVVTGTCDIYNEVGEDMEWRGDNSRTVSYVWTPESLAAGEVGSTGHAPPPAPGNVAFALPRTDPFGWVVTMQPSGGDDYDLALYDDFTDSRHGLSNLRASSVSRSDSLELIAGAGDVLPATLYAAVSRYSVGPAWGAAIEWQSAEGRTGGGEAFWSAESLAWLESAHVYQVQLEAGVTYPMSVWRTVGTVPLAFAVFPPTAGGLFSLHEAAGHSIPVTGQDYAMLPFTPTVTGPHLVVVYRSNSPWEVARYRLAVGSHAVAVNDPEPRADALRILGVQPNPVRARGRLGFVVPAAGPARLTLHDVSGRRVATLLDGVVEVGRHDVELTARDDAGRALAPGLYWARLESQGRVATTTIAVVR